MAGHNSTHGKPYRPTIDTECQQSFLTPASNKEGMSELHWAAYLGKYEEARELLRAGADFTLPAVLKNQMKQAVVGVTPLYLAAQQGHIDIVRLLLEYGADLNQKCGIPCTGEAFGPDDIALIRFHFRTWWMLSQRKSKLSAVKLKRSNNSWNSSRNWTWNALSDIGNPPSPRVAQPLLG